MVTIGELANELLKYSNYVTVTMFKHTPYIVAALSGKNGYVQAYMYIVQTSEGTYSARTDITDCGGARFFPTGNVKNPFIRELEQVQQMFGGERCLNERHYSAIDNASYEDMVAYIYKRLMQFKVVELSDAVIGKRVSSLGFHGPKIARVINKGFNRRGLKSGTIWDLILLVNGLRESFSLEGLNQKDIDTIYNKFKSIGIFLEIRSDYIIDITFMKH